MMRIKNKPKIFSATWLQNDTKNNKKDNSMLPNSSQESIAPPKVQATLDKLRELLELLGIDFY